MPYSEPSQFVEHLENEILRVSFCGFKKEINSLKQTLSEQLKEKESLTTTFNVFKNESKEKEAKNIDKEIALENKVKELDNIVYKMGQSAQTVHMLMKPQVFYNNNLKQALGVQNPFYLKKVHQIRPMLYDGNVIAKETNVISIADSEETLMLEEESRSKMLLNKFKTTDSGKRFVPQQELSAEQEFWFPMSNPSTDSLDASPVKVDVPSELPKLQAKDTTIKKLKAQIKRVSETSTSESVKKDIDEIETINTSIDNIDCRQNCLFIKNDLRKLKGKDIVDNADQVSNATIISPEMYKLDPVPLAPMIVEQAKSLNPLDSASYIAYKYVKLIQELLGYVRDTYPDIHTPRVKPSTSTSGSNPSGNTKNDRISQTPNSNENNKVKAQSRKVKSSLNKMNFDSKNVYNEHVKNSIKGRTFTLVGNVCPSTRITATNKVPLREHIPLEIVAQTPVVTRVYTRRPKAPKKSVQNSKPKVVQIVLWYLDSSCSKHMTRDRSQLTNFVHKFLGTAKFGNNHVAKIMGYGDYQIGNVTISRVYYVEGLGHNLFLVGQFCDSDLEVAFRKHTCFVRNLEGVDLLSGSRGTNLYSLSIRDMMSSSPICLLSKATKTKSWLWHRRLYHLNFGAINHLARHGLVRGLPRLKFEKDHLCSACAMGKARNNHINLNLKTPIKKNYIFCTWIFAGLCVLQV
ncbi:retrovirus-related pol polyprotein from transposon TNT 1-94 [Tanacetum coccineum]